MYLFNEYRVLVLKEPDICEKKTKNKNTHSATQLIKSTVSDGATGLLQGYVSAHHCK